MRFSLLSPFTLALTLLLGTTSPTSVAFDAASPINTAAENYSNSPTNPEEDCLDDTGSRSADVTLPIPDSHAPVYQCISDRGQLHLLNTLGLGVQYPKVRNDSINYRVAERGICTYTIRNGNSTELMQKILDIFRNDFLGFNTISPRLVNNSTLITWWHPNTCLRNQVGRLLGKLDLPRYFPIQDKVQIEVLLTHMNEERFNEIGVMISQLTHQKTPADSSSPGSGNAFNTFLPWGAADIFRIIGISSKTSAAKTIGYYSCLVGNGGRCALTNIDNVYRDSPVGAPIKEFVGFIFGATVQMHQQEKDIVRLEDIDLRLAFPSTYKNAMTQYFEMPSSALDLALGNSTASDSMQIVMGHTKLFDQNGRQIGLGGQQDKDFSSSAKKAKIHSKVMVMVRTTRLKTEEAIDAIRTSQQGGYLPTHYGEYTPQEYFKLPSGFWNFEALLKSLHFVANRSANLMSSMNQYQVIAFDQQYADQKEVLRHLLIKFKNPLFKKTFEVDQLNLSAQNLLRYPYPFLPSFAQEIELNKPIDFRLQVLLDEDYHENKGRNRPKTIGMTYLCRYHPLTNRTDILRRTIINWKNYWFEKW